MKNVIKSLLAVGLLLSVNAFAASSTVTIATGGMSNLMPSFQASAIIQSVIITAPANNTASVTFVDTPTNKLFFTNAAYIGVGSYVSNYWNCWTNFLGRTNCMTNAAIIDYTNTVAAAQVSYPSPIVATAPTNGSFAAVGTSFLFNNGIWVTNTGSGNATVTITYQVQ